MASSSLWKEIQQTLHTLSIMLKDRCYDDVPSLTFELDEFNQLYKENQGKILSVSRKICDPFSNTGDNLAVFYFIAEDGEKFGIRFARHYIELAQEQQYDKMIIITTHGMTPATRKEIQKINRQFQHNENEDQQSKSFSIQSFSTEDLKTAPKLNKMVPPHRPMKTDEKEQFLAKMHITNINQLPLFQPDDKMVQYFDLPHGTLVEIQRLNGITYWRMYP